MSYCLEGIDVAVLAGGLGTRIRGVLGDTPKVLAPINGQPFLDGLLALLARLGASRVILCLGHLADKVQQHLRETTLPAGLTVETVIENSPLGTAGALRLAQPLLRSNPVLVMNGDTWIDADWAGFVAHYRQTAAQTSALKGSILCVGVDDVARYGSLDVDAIGQVIGYQEKDPSRQGGGLISGGVYLFSQDLLREMARQEGPSLERDVLQASPLGQIYGFVSPQSAFIDIGTPESLAAADSVLNWDA